MKTDTQTAIAKTNTPRPKYRDCDYEHSFNRVKLVESDPDILNRLVERAQRAEAHADKLAEALRDALKYADSATEHPENKAAFRRIITTALAEYESAVQP